MNIVTDYLFEAASFMPHGVCLAWRPDLVALHALSDLGIFVAYASIPIALIYFLRRRKDIEFRFVFILFALFILACGATHAFGILTLWQPLYGLQGMMKFITAVVSITTAVMIWRIMPKALALPSPTQLRLSNDKLLKEINNRVEVEEELRRSRDDLERLVNERTLELQQSEQRFRDFAEVSADWFWEQDENLRFKYVSHSNQKITGVLPEDHYGKTRRETGISGVSEDELQTHEITLQERMPFDDFRFQRISNDRGTIHVSITGKPVFDQDGTFSGYRGCGREITQLVEAENQIIDERDKAQKASSAKSSFLANMSHEFRTPLNGIIGYTELLTTDTGRSFDVIKIQKIISDIHVASKHLLALINNVLDLSRIEAEMEVPHLQASDLNQIIKQCLDVTSGIADKNRITIYHDITEELPTVKVDPTHIKQVLINILSNSIKYSGTDSHVKISAADNPDGSVKIRIEDNGVGISEKNLLRVFDAFERVGDPMVSSESGTGLGLSLARQLVELNGGAISMTSQLGQGTTVTIEFPFQEANLDGTESNG